MATAAVDVPGAAQGSRPIAVSTARNHEHALRMFLDYATDARYGWPAVCRQRRC